MSVLCNLFSIFQFHYCHKRDFLFQVLDENDNNPIFESSAFEYRILEDVEPGTTIANIVARDADSGEYGKITYLLDRMSTQVLIK